MEECYFLSGGSLAGTIDMCRITGCIVAKSFLVSRLFICEIKSLLLFSDIDFNIDAITISPPDIVLLCLASNPFNPPTLIGV